MYILYCSADVYDTYTKYNPADVRWDVLNHTMSQYNLHYNHILWLKGLKENVGSRHPSVNTDMFASDVARKDMLKRNVWARRLEWYCVMGKRLKCARKYLWKINEEELGPTAGYSLTTKPLTCPSPVAENNWVRQAMIMDWLDLFKIVCKIDIDTFEKLLTHHPNHTFVDSVLVWLHEGFWPFADMTKEGYPKSWDGSWCLPKTIKEWDFLEEQVWTEIATEHFLESFGMELLPGMCSPPVHAIPKPDSDTMQLIVDHSSGDFCPNLMIVQEDITGVCLNGVMTYLYHCTTSHHAYSLLLSFHTFPIKPDF